VRWSADVGRSYSSPIVTDKFVFVTSEPNLLLCLDRAAGKVLWKVEFKPADLTDAKSRVAAEKYDLPRDGSGLAAATPLTDGQSVYVVLANGLVGAVDLEGKRKWTVGIDAEPTTRYGRSSSPILVGGKLIVHLSNLYAFDPATGRQLWVNTEAKSSYGSPALLRSGEIDLIVTPNGDVVRAADGKSLNNDIGRTVHSSPLACGEGVVCFGDSEVHALKLNAAFKEEEVWSGTVEGEVFGSALAARSTLFLATGTGQLFAFDAERQRRTKTLIDGRKISSKRRPPPGHLRQHRAGGKVSVSQFELGRNRRARSNARGRAWSAAIVCPRQRGTPIFSGQGYVSAGGEKLCVYWEMRGSQPHATRSPRAPWSTAQPLPNIPNLPTNRKNSVCSALQCRNTSHAVAPESAPVRLGRQTTASLPHFRIQPNATPP
jgi:hypothetical protein